MFAEAKEVHKKSMRLLKLYWMQNKPGHRQQRRWRSSTRVADELHIQDISCTKNIVREKLLILYLTELETRDELNNKVKAAQNQVNSLNTELLLNWRALH